jgi:hypothetical protein
LGTWVLQYTSLSSCECWKNRSVSLPSATYICIKWNRCYVFQFCMTMSTYYKTYGEKKEVKLC